MAIVDSVGYILIGLGVILAFYGEVRFLVVACHRNLWWFFGCLLVPLVAWIFLVLNFKATIRPFSLSLFGLLLAGLGGWMSGIVWPG
jgi:hypothetical protein